MSDYLTAVILFLPAGLANAAPVIANKIPGLNRWNTPVDLGKSYRGIRLTGDNKRWRGIVFGSLVAGLAGLLTYGLADRTEPLLIWFIMNALLGFGALYGDTVESFFKRQKGIPSGTAWFPFDQIDYILGGLVAAAAFGLFSWSQMVIILVTYFVLHLIVSYIGFRLGLKDKAI